MRKSFFSLLLLLMAICGNAQKVHFIYIQSENELSFYVKTGGKTINSSATGYLVLSKLQDGKYDIAIGFPQGKWPEQQFSVAVNSRDYGYQLKNFGEKGWALFDLQALTVVAAKALGIPDEGSEKSVAGSATTNDSNVSEFTQKLSKASDDPSLKEKPAEVKITAEQKKAVAEVTVAKEPEKKDTEVVSVKDKQEVTQKEEENKTLPPLEIVKKETVKEEIKKTPEEEPGRAIAQEQKNETQKDIVETDVKPVNNNATDTPAVVAQKEAATGAYQKSKIIRRSESSTTVGFGLVFIDDWLNGEKDTIDILIPNPKTVVKENEATEPGKKFLDVSAAASPEKARQEDNPVESENNGVSGKSAGCAVVATEGDFFALRKDMASAEGNDAMLAEAKKYFGAKCFTTAQVKNLVSLFLNDENRYRFLDIAYNHVSDSANFASLQSVLTDDYYIGRFKAMLRN